MKNLLVLFSFMFSGFSFLSCDSGLPKICFVAEMANFFPEPAISSEKIEFKENEIRLPFLIAWEKVCSDLEARISGKSIIECSRWAKKEMANFSLSPGWLGKIPMIFFHFTKDGECAFFFQDTSKGLPLPAHSPIVFRRLQVGALFGIKDGKIRKVFVTVRGWREE